jgi:hypothetical protein
MLAEEKGSVAVIDDVGGNLRTKLLRRGLSKSLARVAENRVLRITSKRVMITYPESSLLVRSEYDAVPGLLLRWRFKSCHDSLCVLNVSERLLALHQRR